MRNPFKLQVAILATGEREIGLLADSLRGIFRLFDADLPAIYNDQPPSLTTSFASNERRARVSRGHSERAEKKIPARVGSNDLERLEGREVSQQPNPPFGWPPIDSGMMYANFQSYGIRVEFQRDHRTGVCSVAVRDLSDMSRVEEIDMTQLSGYLFPLPAPRVDEERENASSGVFIRGKCAECDRFTAVALPAHVADAWKRDADRSRAAK